MGHPSRSAEAARVFLGGDVMTGRGIDQVLGHPSDPVLYEQWAKTARDYVTLAARRSGPVPEPVADAWPWGAALAALDRRGVHARVVNLETSITRSATPWPDKGINYRMHPGNVGCLTAARLDLCSLANNHVIDWGVSGLLETFEVLQAAGIAWCGAGVDAASAWRPAALPLPSGGHLRVFAFAGPDCGVPASWAAGEGSPGVAFLADLSTKSGERVAERVARERNAGDIVVASIHWGGNWGYEVPPEHVRFAHQLVDGGVDVIHGHSSHHPRPLEVYRDRLVLYGCGDLLNDYEGIAGYESLRPDLVLLYLAQLQSNGALAELELVPMQLRRLQLGEVRSEVDLRWLAAALSRACGPFGSRVALTDDGTLRLVR